MIQAPSRREKLGIRWLVIVKTPQAINWYRKPRRMGLFLALLAGAFLAPATARASCGDYVVFGQSHADPHGQQNPSSTEAQSTQAKQSSAQPMQPVKKPCSGPHCKAGPVQTP